MIRKLIAVFSALCIYSGIFAQQNMTLYQMHDVTQSNFLNPSVAADCKWNVGFPVLGNFSFATGLPISYNDLGAGQEYIESDKILSTIKKKNIISSNINLNILTIGYRSGDLYYQFTMNEKVASKLMIPNTLVEFALKGNAPYLGKTISAGVALSLSYYREYGFNVAYDFGDNLWLGARAKLLFGRIGANSTNNTLSFYTDPNTYALDLTSDLFIHASAPGTMEIDPSDGTVSSYEPEFEVKHFLFNPVNVGGAIDLGVNKTLENGVKISASILNIGIIKWNTNTHQLYQKSTVHHAGATSGYGSWSDLTDELKSSINFNYTAGGAFSQWLSPEIMAGASYPVIDYMRAGLTGYAGISSAGIPWALTATALTDNTSHVFGALSYTVTNSSFVNIGAGLGVRLGPFNIHAMTDNLLAFFNPVAHKYTSFQFGINFIFGCGDGDSRKSSKYKSIPCPSFGHASSKGTTSIPCSSGK
ncbi:MAG: DUF5723 family protein [Prevotellaceae bacterium]|jgi:hypothetical protein|nr:DUF5723 family protein [Prevotellaceae bacterium]